ncbi:type VI secretion system tube protein TssD [Phocaeicola vulgatus]|uniref:type VI secretion system tube protein TssD n=1 Tax=Phocaeicola vulgatus TaxID=821 RepID=UPI0021AA7562|nr:type VI secretion system tube protein TssD [Phocaeicola vulgatus]
MAFKASFKFSDSREFDVLRWDVKFNRDVDPKGRPASDIYGGKIGSAEISGW